MQVDLIGNDQWSIAILIATKPVWVLLLGQHYTFYPDLPSYKPHGVTIQIVMIDLPLLTLKLYYTLIYTWFCFVFYG